jgi:acetyltransferase-like isoleucine patch superfamily enzyme
MATAAVLVRRGLALAYRAPHNISAMIEARAKERKCITSKGTRLLETCKIFNYRDRCSIRIGASSVIRGELLSFGHGGSIRIGDYCYVGENTRIWSSCSIAIGNRVLIAHDVNIHDNNSHSMSASRRHDHFVAIITTGHPGAITDIIEDPIIIEDDAWIGFGAAIFKGLTIGRGAVIAAHSVVTKSVDAFTVVAGNPARVIGQSRE